MSINLETCKCFLHRTYRKLAQAVGVPVGSHSDWQQPQWPLQTALLFFPISFLCCDLFSQKECSDQKTYLAKFDESAKQSRGRQTPFHIPSAILGAPSCHFEFLWCWGIAGQALSECPPRLQAGIYAITHGPNLRRLSHLKHGVSCRFNQKYSCKAFLKLS